MGFIGPRGDWVDSRGLTGLLGVAAEVKGSKELRRKLEHIQGPGAVKALYAGVRAGLTPLTRALRSAVNSSSAPQAVKAAARKTVGQRFAKAGKAGQRDVQAKVGFAVGKKPSKTSKRGLTAHERFVYGQGGAKLTRGVGISEYNIHWFVLGTGERQLKTPHWVVLNGRRVWVSNTGTIKPYLAGLTQGALAAASGSALEKARAKIADVIAKEAAKRR